MSAFVYALALFGCSDDATFCERLTDNAQSFESRVQCEMAVDAAFDTDAALKADYPTVIGKCIDQGSWAKLGDKPLDLSNDQIMFASRERNSKG